MLASYPGVQVPDQFKGAISSIQCSQPNSCSHFNLLEVALKTGSGDLFWGGGTAETIYISFGGKKTPIIRDSSGSTEYVKMINLMQVFGSVSVPASKISTFEIISEEANPEWWKFQGLLSSP